MFKCRYWIPPQGWDDGKGEFVSSTKPSVVFFGSGPVAAKSLRLLMKHCEVEAVITKPSTERDMKAVADQLSIFTVSTKAELDKLINEKRFTSRLGILIDFGIIVSQRVIDSFEKGIINSHFSLLPEWRGADPISFSILSGQEKAGVSLMLVNLGLDTGNLITQTAFTIPVGCTTPELTKSLIKISDESLRRTIPAWLSGKVLSAKQEEVSIASSKIPTYSRKLTKSDGVLDFNKPAEQLEREVRAFIDWPKSHTEIAGKDVVVLKASVDQAASGSPGEVFKTHNKKIGIFTPKGALIIEELKPAGKSAMSAEGFLAGYGTRL